MREPLARRALALLSAAPALLAALALARLSWDLARQPPVVVELPASSCPGGVALPPGSACTLKLPDRRGTATSLRIYLDGSLGAADPRSAWQACMGKEAAEACRDSAPALRWGQVELALPEAPPGSIVSLRLLRAEAPVRLAPGSSAGRARYAFPGWTAVLGRAREMAHALAPGLFWPATLAFVTALLLLLLYAARAANRVEDHDHS